MIPVVAAVIVNRDNEYLLCRRPLEKRHGGMWEFPGGKVNENETKEEALVREVREELGVSCVVGASMGSYPDTDSPYQIYYYKVAIREEPKLLEHMELGWFDLDRIYSTRHELTPSGDLFVWNMKSPSLEDASDVDIRNTLTSEPSWMMDIHRFLADARKRTERMEKDLLALEEPAEAAKDLLRMAIAGMNEAAAGMKEVIEQWKEENG